MAKITQNFINNLECLYEEINIQEQDFLNENSDYYDAEMSYLVEDILSTISTEMIYEGYSASAIIGFLADSSTQDILEKYLTFDENILLENTIPEEYIQEQLEIFDYCIDEGLGSLIGKLAKGAVSLAGRIASKPARMRASKIMSNASNPEKARELLQTTAQKSARKANVGGYSATQSPIDARKLSAKQSAELLTKAKIERGTQKVKDIAKGAKAALPGIAKGALLAGTGVLAGYTGAKLNGGGESPTGSPKISPNRKKSSTPAAPAAPSGGGTSSSRGGNGGTPLGGGGGKSPTQSPKKSEDKGPEGETPMQKWARLHPNLASKVKPGQSGYDEISATRQKPGSGEKQDQTPTQGPKTTPEQEKDLAQQAAQATKEFQDSQKKKLEQKNTTTNESYDAFDMVLEYLTSGGHVDSLDEALYVMLGMTGQEINSICEAKYGTAKGREKLAKKVRAGKDVGKKGAGFEAIVDKATPKYGKERATKIAAAAMWKNLGK